MTVFLGVGLWSSWVASYNSLVATRFVGGLAAGVVEGVLFENPIETIIKG